MNYLTFFKTITLAYFSHARFPFHIMKTVTGPLITQGWVVNGWVQSWLILPCVVDVSDVSIM